MEVLFRFAPKRQADKASQATEREWKIGRKDEQRHASTQGYLQKLFITNFCELLILN